MTLHSRAHFGQLCLVLLLLCAPIAGHAAEQPGWREARDMRALVEALDSWLDAHSSWPRPAEPPAIRLISPANASSMAGPAARSGALIPRGFYDEARATVYLVEPWNARDPQDVSVLLHELVHHRQADSYWYCDDARELPAYRLQQAWLNRMGLEPRVNWVAVVLEAGCTRRDFHPD